MPYKRKGSVVYHQKGGKWSIKQKTKSPANAKKAMNLLRGIEHGNWKPTGRPARKTKKRK